MSGKIIVSIVFGIIIIGGGAWWLNSTPSAEQPARTESATSSTQTANPTSMSDIEERSASFREMMTRGEALTCTFTFTDDGVRGTGTGYFANDERMRMESTITHDGETYAAHYIIDDDTMYMWGEMQPGDFGIQMSLSATAEETATDEPDMPVAMDEDIDFSCATWSVDESVFTLPTDIEFMDMNAMMQGAHGMTPEQMQALQEQYAQ